MDPPPFIPPNCSAENQKLIPTVGKRGGFGRPVYISISNKNATFSNRERILLIIEIFARNIAISSKTCIIKEDRKIEG